TVLATGNFPAAIALDIAEEKMYWLATSVSSIRFDIQSANLDGTGVTTLASDLPASSPSGLAVDARDGFLYWTDNSGINRAKLDGTDITNLLPYGQVNIPLGITLDVSRNKMYWADYGNGTIERANLDGTGREVVVSYDVGGNLNSQLGLDLV